MSKDCVVDASAGIKLFLDEDLSDRADQLFAGLARTPPADLFVPDLFFIECANILWKYARRFGCPLENAQKDVSDLVSLPLQVVSTAKILQDALVLAVTHEISAYDAAYVALAQRLSLPLVTADQALVRKLPGVGVDMLFLGDWKEA